MKVNFFENQRQGSFMQNWCHQRSEAIMEIISAWFDAAEQHIQVSNRLKTF